MGTRAHYSSVYRRFEMYDCSCVKQIRYLALWDKITVTSHLESSTGFPSDERIPIRILTVFDAWKASVCGVCVMISELEIPTGLLRSVVTNDI